MPSAFNREEAILSLQPTIRSVVNQLIAGRGIEERDDLMGAGWIAAIQAVDRFDPSRGVPLSLWARQRIKGAMLDYFRSIDCVTRGHRASIRNGEAEPVNHVVSEAHFIEDRRSAQVWERLDASISIHAALGRASLTARMRAILRLELQGWSMSEIAQDIGVSRASIWQSHHAAKKQLISACA